MTTELFLIPGSTPDDPVDWGIRDTTGTGGTRTGHALSMNELATVGFGRVDRVTVIVPGTEVTLHQVTLPARSETQARAALPFAIEDDLAADLEDVHATLGPKGENGTRAALVVARKRMDDWLAALAGSGLSADVMIPDYLAFGQDGESAAMFMIDGRVVVGSGQPWGFAASPDILPLVLAPALKRQGILRLRVACEGGEIDAALSAVEGIEVEREAAPELASLIETAQERLRRGGVINMLDGPYGVQRGWQPKLSKWRMVAALLGVLVASQMLLLASEAWRLDRQAQALDMETEVLFRETFPDVQRVVNVRAQMRTRLGELRAGSSGRYLELSGALYKSVQASEQARLEAVRFDRTRRELVADISYGAYEDMERLKSAAARMNTEVEEGSARQSGGRTLGEIMMRLP